jgi:hypothetical protein
MSHSSRWNCRFCLQPHNPSELAAVLARRSILYDLIPSAGHSANRDFLATEDARVGLPYDDVV